MKINRLLLSFLVTVYMAYLICHTGIRFQSPLQSQRFQTLGHTVNITTIKDVPAFMKTRTYEELTYLERKELVQDYLQTEGKKVYECIIHGNNTKKCFSFKTDVIYAKKIYREEDMAMKYPHQYNLVINNPDACSSNPQIIIGSPVGPRQFLERMSTRQTWGSVQSVDGIGIKHLFFAGQDENDPEGDRMLREENDDYHDIIQFDMKNHFMNLTLLAILTYNWTDVYCPNIKYYIRSDNDMWLNPHKIVREFFNKDRSNALMGNPITHGKPIRVSVSRYYLSKNVYEPDFFYPYMSGCFLAMTRDVLPIIVKRCEDIGPIIYFDDVFLGQIARIANISLVNFPYSRVIYYPRAYTGRTYTNLWAAHRISPIDNIAMWQLTHI